MSTVDWMDEMSSEFQTNNDGVTEAATTTPGSPPTVPVSLIASRSVLALFGYLGTITNGLVLLSIWLAGKSAITSSSIHIVNHTALTCSLATLCTLPFSVLM